jgi:CRP-like cAMP-binding protein
MKYLELGQKPELMEQVRSVRSELSDAAFRCFRLCRFDAGELLYTEGQQAGCFLILLAGSCKVFKTLENGRTVLLCLYDDIQVIGEFELFGDPVAKTNVQALTETYCLAAFVQDQREQLLADNSFLQFVCRQTCAKTERNNANIAINLLYPLEQRLVGYVLVMQKNGVFSANYTLLAETLGCSLRQIPRLSKRLRGMCTASKVTPAYLLPGLKRESVGSSHCGEPFLFVLTSRGNGGILILRLKY